jgi:hypothetical protein
MQSGMGSVYQLIGYCDMVRSQRTGPVARYGFVLYGIFDILLAAGLLTGAGLQSAYLPNTYGGCRNAESMQMFQNVTIVAQSLTIRQGGIAGGHDTGVLTSGDYSTDNGSPLRPRDSSPGTSSPKPLDSPDDRCHKFMVVWSLGIAVG